ncbi:hypothetical protein L2X99_05210 [Microbacterium sp. KUDC0406]|uniref:shikimate dehydrogenase family protein n=1 Tax=Microbacterium sp. KUDC0406 TaxID=2909588 RepID=UPI001F1C25AE|nr:hypothetical protein [Microbacterium sp. KUDC0406]UJP10996.1 hypothetical protein L2X99_05210 [Microbacterium sp. KUDC0406]
MSERTRLAVWGDPIAHSRSPQLHGAAYRSLGLDWTYDRRQVDVAGFAGALAGLDDTWRGLSLTMPLKERAFRAADVRDRHAELTGAVNTLLLGDALHGFNTDVGGIVDAVTAAGVTAIGSARILGAGATAASALIAVADLGAERVEIRARRPEAAVHLVALGNSIGVQTSVSAFAEPGGIRRPHDRDAAQRRGAGRLRRRRALGIRRRAARRGVRAVAVGSGGPVGGSDRALRARDAAVPGRAADPDLPRRLSGDAAAR